MRRCGSPGLQSRPFARLIPYTILFMAPKHTEAQMTLEKWFEICGATDEASVVGCNSDLVSGEVTEAHATISASGRRAAGIPLEVA
jgi:hypothetical protein